MRCTGSNRGRMAEHRRASRPHAVAAAVFALYAVALVAIVFWPTPVDRGAGRLLSAITRRIPFLTYDVIEFTANIALFVPFGILLAILLKPRRRSLVVAQVVAFAFAIALAIEVSQGVFLAERTASVLDVVANMCGAVLGSGAVPLAERLSLRRT